MGPNPTQTLPTWTAVCIAYKRDQEIDRRTTVVGQNASSREAGFRAVADATALAKDLLGIFPSSSVMIFTADHFVLPYCQITDRHDNASACRAICNSTAAILDTHTNTTLSLGWLPGKTSFRPLERLQELAIEAAALAPPDLDLSNPSPEALRVLAKNKALEAWSQAWLDTPRTSPVYRALHHPPSLEPLEFIRGVRAAPRPIFCTAVRLLTEHAFTGEYNARHRSHTGDPHLCDCEAGPLQTASHIIFHCDQHRAAREHFLHPVSDTLSPNIIFGMEAGGRALAKFIEATQAGVRPRKEIPPEDHG